MISFDTLTSILNRVLPEPHAGLLSGILFGTKATLDAEFKQALMTTGTLHIVALSGMNISILTVLVNLVLIRYVKRPIANMLSVAIIIGFIWFVGPSPSVIRAAIMGSISLLSVSVGRQSWPILSWILAVFIMLLLNPLWIADVSFQLSILATLGIILFSTASKVDIDPVDPLSVPGNEIQWSQSADDTETTQKATGLLGTLPGILLTFLRDDLCVTLAAQVFTIPVIFFQFHRISLISPVTNVLIGWLIAPVTVIGFVIVGAGLFWMPLAYAAGWIAWVLLSAIIGAVRLTASIPFAGLTF